MYCQKWEPVILEWVKLLEDGHQVTTLADLSDGVFYGKLLERYLPARVEPNQNHPPDNITYFLDSFFPDLSGFVNGPDPEDVTLLSIVVMYHILVNKTDGALSKRCCAHPSMDFQTALHDLLECLVQYAAQVKLFTRATLTETLGMHVKEPPPSRQQPDCVKTPSKQQPMLQRKESLTDLLASPLARQQRLNFEIRKDIWKIEDELDQERLDRKRIEAQLDKESMAVKNLQAKLTKKTEEIDSLNNELCKCRDAQVERDRVKLVYEKQQLDEIASLEAYVAQLQDELHPLRDEFERVQARLARAAEASDEWERKAAAALVSNAWLSEDLGAAGREMTALRELCEEQQRHMREMKRGDVLDSSVECDDAFSPMRGPSVLLDRMPLSVTVVDVQLRELQAQIANLQESQEVLSASLSGKEQDLEKCAARFKHLSNEHEATLVQLSVSESRVEQLSVELDSTLQRLTERSEQLDSLSEEHESMLRQFAECKARVDNLSQDHHAVTAKLAESVSRFEVLSAAHASVSDLLTDSKLSLGKLSQEYTLLTKQLAENVLMFERLSTEHQSTTAQVRSWEAKCLLLMAMGETQTKEAVAMTTEISSLGEKKLHLEVKIAQLESQAVAMAAEKPSDAEKIVLLEYQMETLCSEVAAVMTQKSSLEQKISELKRDIEILSTENVAITAEKSALEEKISFLKAEAIVLVTEKSCLEVNISRLEGEIKTLESEAVAMATDKLSMEEKLCCLEREIETLRIKSFALTKEKSCCEEKILLLQGQIEIISAEATAVLNVKSSLKEEISLLEEEVIAVTTVKSSLEEKIFLLEQEVTAITNKKSSLEEKISLLEQETIATASVKSSMKEEISRQERNIKTLSTEIATTTEQRTFEEKCSRLMEDVSANSSELNIAKHRIASLLARNEKLRDDIAAHSAASLEQSRRSRERFAVRCDLISQLEPVLALRDELDEMMRQTRRGCDEALLAAGSTSADENICREVQRLLTVSDEEQGKIAVALLRLVHCHLDASNDDEDSLIESSGTAVVSPLRGIQNASENIRTILVRLETVRLRLASLSARFCKRALCPVVSSPAGDMSFLEDSLEARPDTDAAPEVPSTTDARPKVASPLQRIVEGIDSWQRTFLANVAAGREFDAALHRQQVALLQSTIAEQNRQFCSASARMKAEYEKKRERDQKTMMMYQVTENNSKVMEKAQMDELTKKEAELSKQLKAQKKKTAELIKKLKAEKNKNEIFKTDANHYHAEAVAMARTGDPLHDSSLSVFNTTAVNEKKLILDRARQNPFVVEFEHATLDLGMGLEKEDKECNQFDGKHLADLKAGRCTLPVPIDPIRLSQLQKRNSQYLPHLKSSYPTEMNLAESTQMLREEDIMHGYAPDAENSSVACLNAPLLPGDRGKGQNESASAMSPRPLREHNSQVVDTLRSKSTTPSGLCSSVFKLGRQNENPPATPRRKRTDLYSVRKNK